MTYINGTIWKGILMSDEIKIEAGKRREFPTGAERQSSEGKGTPVLVPGDAIIDIAKHFEKGADVYGARNWEKGIPLSELLNSLERHLQQLKMGLTDEPHARALAWNAVVYLATTLRIENGLLPAELDDMPTYQLNPDIFFEEDTETIEEVMEINEEMAKELKKEAAKESKDEPAEDEERSPLSASDNGRLYCNELNCYNKGFPKKGVVFYYCPKHPKKGN